MNMLMTPYNYPLNLVLLIDDDDTTNYLNERLLREMQVAREYKVLKNGKEAIEYTSKAFDAKPNAAFPRPDLILLDIKMPVMDGFSFLDVYQQNNLDQDNPVIILMLTSSASFYDLERLKQYSKVKKHYSKSLTKYDVRDIMSEFFKTKV